MKLSGMRKLVRVEKVKTTYNFIRAAFDSGGYVLLRLKEYKGSDQKLECICPNGHNYMTSWHRWGGGYRCGKCAGNVKHSLDFIRSEFKKEGYKLLSNVYANNKQKLAYICPKGHEGSVRWDAWVRGVRCGKCAGNIKYTIDFVRAEFEREGYRLVSSEYVNNKCKLDYVCPVGHSGSITYNSWKQGCRCFECFGRKKHTLEFIKSEFEKEGYKLLTGEYNNCEQKLEYVCAKGHNHFITWHSWTAGQRCGVCGKKSTAEKLKLQYNEVCKSFESEGYKLLSRTYKNAFVKLKYICSLGHTHSIKWNDWQQGRRCPVCARLNKSGSNNCNWRGGISFEPYCDAWSDKEYKNYIRARDDHRCCNPNCSSKNPNDLTIHHIDYNKKNCGPNNLITLCRSCNSKANFNRDYHEEFYSDIINRREYVANGRC